MSIQMSGKGCSSCRFSTEYPNRLEYLRCTVHPGKKRSYDYCAKWEDKYENIDDLIESNPEFKRVLGLLREVSEDQGTMGRKV